MSDTLFRLWAIVKTDFFIRFRKPSTVVIFLLLCFIAYMAIPSPSTGLAIMIIGKQRTVYNSAAIAISTALLATSFLTLFGFYLVSSSIKVDIQSRTGFIIASTNIRNWEYVVGKFLGNILFLSSIIAGFMLSSMVMQLVRGESRLEPLVFLTYYLFLTPPAIVFISCIALLFETISFLSGKLGDIIYFFIWMFTLVFSAVLVTIDNHINLFLAFDISGLGFIGHEFQQITHSPGFSIGASPFDTTQTPYYFPGITITFIGVITRFSAIFPSLILLAFAWLFFHRFNPTRIKTVVQKSRQGLISKLNSLLKPITNILNIFPSHSNELVNPSLFNTILSDALLTLKLYPIAIVLIIIFGVASILQPLPKSILPAMFGVLILVLADISTRENSFGITNLIYAMPFIKRNFVWWKFATSLLISLSFTLIPILKLLFLNRSAAISLFIGSLFISAMSVFLGVVTANAKTFIVLFLSFWYLVLNDNGQSKSFDFAGWYAIATPSVQLFYIVISFIMLALTQIFYLWQQKRQY